MNTLRKLAFAAAALFAWLGGPSAYAQLVLTPTTLSSAIADGSTQVMNVASVTNVTGYTVVAGTVGYIDKEEVVIKPLNGTVSGTTLAIIRGQGGTSAAPHASGALVWLGPSYAFFSKPILHPAGGCTRGNLIAVPYINVAEGVISDCLGGQWINGVRTNAPQYKVSNPNTGGTAYTSINTSGTTLAATTMYCTEVDLPTNKLLTGIAVLNGTSADGTDKHLVALYDSGGNLLANSALAGAATSGASVFQTFAFTSTFFAVGPAQYFACMQTNGTTNTVRMAVTGSSADTILTKGVTGQTFGTLASFTAPTSFTTAVGPYVYLY